MPCSAVDDPTRPGKPDASDAPPAIAPEDAFPLVARKLAVYLVAKIHAPHTFDELRSTSYHELLHPLVDALATHARHIHVVSALLALRGHFALLDDGDDRHVNLARAYACEIVAGRFVSCLSPSETVLYLLTELQPALPYADADPGRSSAAAGDGADGWSYDARDRAALRRPGGEEGSDDDDDGGASAEDLDALGAQFDGLNALEIASVSEAKRFLSQDRVQRVIDGIWKGDIIFWDSLSVHATKRPQLYSQRHTDPFCRLRVPRYLKIYEVLFFAAFLALYYAVIVERNAQRLNVTEIVLVIWIAAFAYEEFVQYTDAGLKFYTVDFWSVFDLFIVAVGVAFFACRIVGLSQRDARLTDTSFDILSLQALFLVPRICSLLSLHPFFGTLIPCLKEMTKYSSQFLFLVGILYLGFFTTFTLLARDHYSPGQMSWMLVKVFFGSSYIGFDEADKISPTLGTPLMLVFVWMTNILLLTGLTSLMSNRLTEVMEHAREEYLYLYSVFVLEASTSNRLTYYLPPLNMLALLFRPLRLLLPSGPSRAVRIQVLKWTHAPWIAAIWCAERLAAARRHRPSARRRRRQQHRMRPWTPVPALPASPSSSRVAAAATRRDSLERTAAASISSSSAGSDSSAAGQHPQQQQQRPDDEYTLARQLASVRQQIRALDAQLSTMEALAARSAVRRTRASRQEWATGVDGASIA